MHKVNKQIPSVSLESLVVPDNPKSAWSSFRNLSLPPASHHFCKASTNHIFRILTQQTLKELNLYLNTLDGIITLSLNNFQQVRLVKFEQNEEKVRERGVRSLIITIKKKSRPRRLLSRGLHTHVVVFVSLPTLRSKVTHNLVNRCQKVNNDWWRRLLVGWEEENDHSTVPNNTLF